MHIQLKTGADRISAGKLTGRWIVESGPEVHQGANLNRALTLPGVRRVNRVLPTSFEGRPPNFLPLDHFL